MVGHLLLILKKLRHRHADIPRDLPEQDGRDVTALMEGNGGLATVVVSKLLVRAALPDLSEPVLLEQRDHLSRFEDRELPHERGSGDLDLLGTDELGFQARFPILQEHGDHLSKVLIEFIKGLGLAMGTWKSRHKADQEAGLGATLDDRGEVLHT